MSIRSSVDRYPSIQHISPAKAVEAVNASEDLPETQSSTGLAAKRNLNAALFETTDGQFSTSRLAGPWKMKRKGMLTTHQVTVLTKKPVCVLLRLQVMRRDSNMRDIVHASREEAQ
jgi:hypothetical protein